MAAHIPSHRCVPTHPGVPHGVPHGGRYTHQGDVWYMLVCRVTLGYSARTLGAPKGEEPRRLYDVEHPSHNVFDRTVKRLYACPLMPPANAFEHHSLVAELGPHIFRYREFIVYHQDAVPMYLMAYHRV